MKNSLLAAALVGLFMTTVTNHANAATTAPTAKEGWSAPAGLPNDRGWTPAEIQKALPFVKDESRRKTLEMVNNACFTQHWAECRLALRDLRDVGLEKVDNEEDIWKFKGDRVANHIYFSVQDAVHGEKVKRSFEITINNGVARNLPAQIIGGMADTPGPWRNVVRDAFAAALQMHQIDTRAYYIKMRPERAEAIRYLAQASVLKNNYNDANAMLAALQHYAKRSSENTLVYNDLIEVTSRYASAQQQKRRN